MFLDVLEHFIDKGRERRGLRSDLSGGRGRLSNRRHIDSVEKIAVRGFGMRGKMEYCWNLGDVGEVLGSFWSQGESE